jgi:hypothetical protein
VPLSSPSFPAITPCSCRDLKNLMRNPESNQSRRSGAIQNQERVLK